MPGMIVDIDSVESLYRQLNPNLDKQLKTPWFYDKGQPPIPAAFFAPSSSDITGLSMIRARFRTEPWAAYRITQPEVRFKLAVLTASRLTDHEAGMTITITPDDIDQKTCGPAAHVEIPELAKPMFDNKATRQQAKQRRQLICEKLVYEVIGPYERPTDDVPIIPPSSVDGGC